MSWFSQAFGGLGQGGIAGGIEKLVTGENLGRLIRDIEFNARKSGELGRGLTTEGLNDLRGLNDRFQKQLDDGGLTPELQRQFDVEAGRNTDQYVRSGRALKAALEARRNQGGGALTAGAIAELEKEGEVSASEQYFDASNNLAGEKAMLTFNSTKDLFDRMTNIADTIRTTGLTYEQQAMLARLQAASLHFQRNKAIDESARSWTSMFMGGMGG